MKILGIHKDPWHDTGAAVIRDDGDGPRYVHVAEERLDRVKNSRAFPERSIEACLAAAGISSVEDLDLVVMDHIRDGADWRRDHFRQPCRTDVFLADVPPDRLRVINHHLAHACSAFYSSPFPQAAVLVVDGRGSNDETQSLWRAGPRGLELVSHTTCIGIGLLYAAVTQAIGFGLLQEGKTMGLAPYGGENSRIFEFPHVFEGVVTDYAGFCAWGSYDILVPHSPLDSFEAKAQAAWEVQDECEQAMLHLARHAREATGEEYLCISGGVGLNSVANYKVLQSGIFRDVFVNPACSDTGIALGAALYGYHVEGKADHRCAGISPYIGPVYDQGRIDRALAGTGLTVLHDDAIRQATRLLVGDAILGCFHGGSEMGPRALGNRSILVNPLIADNKDRLNKRVKHREHFRPFAPAVLVERVSEYFELDRPCPHMLMVAVIRPEKRSLIPAVTHVDGTGRLQTVAKEDNPVFYSLIEAFGQKTGVPVLLNTSFNVNGEPIVETPEDAVRCFLGTEIDALLIGERLVLKPAAEEILRR